MLDQRDLENLIGVMFREPGQAMHAFSVCDALPGGVVIEYIGGKRERITSEALQRLLRTHERW